MGGFADILLRDLGAMGPVPFAEWMRRCLYHPVHGYYSRGGRKTGAGPDADFVTPPTLHPFFAEAVAKEIRDGWVAMGRPDRFEIHEHGGGEGGLALTALRWLDTHEPALAQAARWTHLEHNPRHGLGGGEDDPRIGWLRPGAAAGPPHLVLLVEVLDAQPADIYEWTGEGWDQVLVAADGGRFVETLRGRPHDVLEAMAWPGPEAARGMRPGDRLARSRAATWFRGNVLEGTGAGRILVVDYGSLDARRAQVRGYRRHQAASPLERPGETDITCSVNFGAIRDEAEQLGFAARPLETLEEFLLHHGILEELNRIDRNAVEGASAYLRLRQLLLPTGMGAAFKVQRFDRAVTPEAPGAAG